MRKYGLLLSGLLLVIAGITSLGLLLKLKEAKSCGVKIINENNIVLRIKDKRKWQEYYKGILNCNQKGLMEVTLPDTNRLGQVQQVKLIFTNSSFSRLNRKQRLAKNVYVIFRVETGADNSEIIYYISPIIGLDKTEQDKANTLLVKNLHFLLTVLAPEAEKNRDEMYKQMMNQYPSLAEMGLGYIM
jgi:hypothetical protein